MSPIEIYETLSRVGDWWAQQSRRVRWAAARYYAGVDSLKQLRALAEPQIVTDQVTLEPTLTKEQVNMIVMLR